MAKSNHWGHTKFNLENQSKSGRRKGLKEVDKQEDKFNKLVDKLRESTRQGRDKAGTK
jgi:hypothetical protein